LSNGKATHWPIVGSSLLDDQLILEALAKRGVKMNTGCALRSIVRIRSCLCLSVLALLSLDSAWAQPEEYNSSPNGEGLTLPLTERVYPYVFDGDLRDLPPAEQWRPGDPIIENPDFRTSTAVAVRSPAHAGFRENGTFHPSNVDDLYQKIRR
jgi:hypothetical protein